VSSASPGAEPRAAEASGPRPYVTVGHSNRSLETFVGLLREAEVGLVVDVRKLPGSRKYPHFNAEPLQAALADVQIGYSHIAALGGRRGKAPPDAPRGLNGLWTNTSFRNYADYALGEAFAAGLAELVAAGRLRRCAIMCAEAVWWRCHRRIIADHLLARGETVIHLMGEGRREPARLTPGAQVQPDGTVLYPAP
jgi:uncharacterized protein (DUF488 family)